MFKNLKKKVRAVLGSPFAWLGFAGVSMTAVACYGPPAYLGHEIKSETGEILWQCIDGTQAKGRCDSGCRNSMCNEYGGIPGDACHKEAYTESPAVIDGKLGDLTCNDGKVTFTPRETAESADYGNADAQNTQN